MKITITSVIPIFILLMVFPVISIAQQVAIVPNDLINWIQESPWYSIAFAVVGGMKMLTMWINDTWAEKYPGLKQLNMVMNWLALNIFNDKNASKK